jgi:4-hydroxybenzoate polyprenyltransferase
VKPLIRFIDLLLYTSVFAALCATALCMATERLISNTTPMVVNSLHLLVLGSTLAVYNTPRIAKMLSRKQAGKREYHNWYIFFFCVGIIIAGTGLYRQTTTMLIACCMLGIVAFSYFLPVLPFKNRKRLRDFGGIKIIVLTGVWTVATSILPILYWQKNIADYPLEITIRFVLVFILCVLFDLRDMQPDLKSSIYTIPNKVGIENSYRLIYATLVLFVILSVLQYFRHPVSGRLVSAAITAAATWLVTQYVKKQPGDRVYLLLVDGVMLLYALLVLLY